VRLLFVVQRYGHEVAGGAELHCRQFATRLAARGHEVGALASCAVSHVEWTNFYPPGEVDIDGVRVRRLTVSEPKDERFFAPVYTRVVLGSQAVPLFLQRRWMERQGPLLADLVPLLDDTAGSYDAVVFFTYLFYPTWAGLPVASRRTPTVLHPTAHDEPALYLRLYDTTFRHPWAFAFSTPEEAALVRRRFGVSRPSDVIGIGVDLEGEAPDPTPFREAFGLGDRPYLVFLGRFECSKGSDEIYDFFATYKSRNPGPLALVVVGKLVEPRPPHPDIVFTGFVDESTRRSALGGAVALVQPSYFESFSMVLTEAWAERKPALVQGHTEVLEAQARRSGGGLPYRGYAEFEAAVDLLTEDASLAEAMGEAGRRYVERHYGWDTVMSRYERLLERAASLSSGKSRTLSRTRTRIGAS
jgi:glycosyltransferase involved in cell wall biosynthesis